MAATYQVASTSSTPREVLVVAAMYFMGRRIRQPAQPARRGGGNPRRRRQPCRGPQPAVRGDQPGRRNHQHLLLRLRWRGPTPCCAKGSTRTTATAPAGGPGPESPQQPRPRPRRWPCRSTALSAQRRVSVCASTSCGAGAGRRAHRRRDRNRQGTHRRGHPLGQPPRQGPVPLHQLRRPGREPAPGRPVRPVKGLHPGPRPTRARPRLGAAPPPGRDRQRLGRVRRPLPRLWAGTVGRWASDKDYGTTPSSSPPATSRPAAARWQGFREIYLAGGDHHQHAAPAPAREDIPVLVKYYLEEYVDLSGRRPVGSAGALEKMLRHGWPGNIREPETAWCARWPAERAPGRACLR